MSDQSASPQNGDGSRYFVYKLIPPRPTFDRDMSDEEAAIMGRHGGYWQGHVEGGRAVVFGPVADPAGTWGLAVVKAAGEEDVRALAREDPAISSGLARYEILPMLVAVVRA